MCSPVVPWTHPGEHPRPDMECRHEQEAVYVQRGIFYLRSLLLVSAYRSLSLCFGGQRSPREAGRRAGERPRGKGNIDV